MSGAEPAARNGSRIAANDGYEAAFMVGEGKVLLRDKQVGRNIQWLLTVPALFCVAGSIAAFSGIIPNATLAEGILLLLPASFFLFCWATLTVLRTLVTTNEVHVQYGLWGPRIPIKSICSCQVADTTWTQHGGWGIRRTADGGWAYMMPSNSGQVVELLWTDEHGKSKKVVFSAADPQRVVAAIRHARLSHGCDEQ